MSVQRVSIVGCGLTGCVVARELAEKGHHVTLYDRRQHVGGNLYDYTDEHGILVHRYGPHTFHTDSERVWQYVNKYGEWEPYQLVCGAVIDGVCVPTAFDFTTVDTFFSQEDAEQIKARLRTRYPHRATVTILELLDSDNPFIRRYAEFLYEKDYKLYAAKQWDTTPDRLDRSIFSRVPVRIGYKRAYFDDKYQAMPKHGYVRFISHLLEHPQIRGVVLGVDMTDKIHFAEGKAFLTEGGDETIVYTGALDELFGYRFGRLPYRSLRFEWKYEDTESLQDMPVVAYPQAAGYTRITEYKKLPVQHVRGTSYAVEYPLPYATENSSMEPYYPVLTDESKAAYEQYRTLAGNYPNLFCCGRLADFKYYDMDQAIENALTRTQEIGNG